MLQIIRASLRIVGAKSLAQSNWQSIQLFRILWVFHHINLLDSALKHFSDVIISKISDFFISNEIILN